VGKHNHIVHQTLNTKQMLSPMLDYVNDTDYIWLSLY